MPLTDYKAKYMDLKMKYLETVDLSFRLGYEQGLKDSQLEQMQQQQMQADAMAQQPGTEQQGAMPAEEGAPEADQQTAPVSENPNGDELGQHIEKLESMLGKSEISSGELQDLKKTLNDIRSLQVQINLTKSMESSKNTKMGKTKAPMTITPKLHANLSDHSKKALSLQEKIVTDIFSKWDKDSSSAASDISSVIKMEGLTKKE